MKARVYIETSDVVAAGHQQISLDWWERRRTDFDLVTSLLVVNEARLGNPEMARRRLALLEGIPLLEVTEAAQQLAVAIVQKGLLPQTAYPDALHIGTAAVHQVDYLLTWNCAHIAMRRSCRALL